MLLLIPFLPFLGFLINLALGRRLSKAVSGVMDKNWLHIRDGSGTDGTNDLTVTTSAEVKVGDTVTISGTLAIDKDFGAGYAYDHDTDEAFSGQNYFPDALPRQQFYNPPKRGFEREIRKRLDYWAKLRKERGGQ